MSELDEKRAQRLRDARDAIGLSIEDVAAAVGVPVETVIGWEAGEPIPHRGRHANELAEALKQPVRWFETGEEDAGIRIARRRLARGWSQGQLARRVRVGLSTLQNWESGTSRFDAHIAKAETLANVLRTTVPFLATGDESAMPPVTSTMRDDEWVGRLLALEDVVAELTQVAPGDRRGRARPMTEETSLGNQVTKLRADLEMLTKSVSALLTFRRNVGRRLRKLEAGQEPGSEEDQQPPRP